jgi:exodeoxyribonuclease VII small subunit
MSDQPTFEQALRQLEEAVARLEKGALPLDESLACFEVGVQSANLCRKLLQQVEKQVDVLVRQADGEFATQVFVEDTDPDS